MPPRKRSLTARTADKYVLYQEAVQGPEVDARFLSRHYQRTIGRPPRILREDFCGTAILACWFVHLHRENHAFGVDLHGPTLAWGRKHTVPRLPEAEQSRVKLVKANVMDVSRPRADIIAALNFSYGIFKTRATLGAYVRNCRRSLRQDGLLFLDAWGGSDTQRERPDRIKNRGFVYVWDQVRFDPVNYHTLCRIHFEFPDGTRIRNAFDYDWRLWTLPELQELMAEAGFRDIHVLWEGTHRKTGKGNGVFHRVTKGHADRAWIAYVVGRAGAPATGRSAPPARARRSSPRR